MCAQLGGTVEAGHEREFGRAVLDIVDDCALFEDVWNKGDHPQVWMSHGDRVTALPPGFRTVATSGNAPFAAIADEQRRFFGVQFHPEVVHQRRMALLSCATSPIGWRDAVAIGPCGPSRRRPSSRSAGRWARAGSFVDCRAEWIASVAAALLHEAIGPQLTCVFRRSWADAPGRSRTGGIGLP